MRTLATLLLATLALSGCAFEKRTPTSPPGIGEPQKESARAGRAEIAQVGTCRSEEGPAAVETVRYLGAPIERISIFPPGGDVADGAELTDPAEIQPIQAALAGARVASPDEAREFQPWTPDAVLILWTESPPAKWAIEWRSGSSQLRLVSDGRGGGPVWLKARYDCVPPLAQAVNAAFSHGCAVSPIAYPFKDLAMGRGAEPVWAIDGGSVWKRGMPQKVLLRIRGAGPEPPLVTAMRSDGKTVKDIHVTGPAGNVGQPPNVRDFPSGVTLPEPGCWTLTVKSGNITGKVTVRVR